MRSEIKARIDALSDKQRQLLAIWLHSGEQPGQTAKGNFNQRQRLYAYVTSNGNQDIDPSTLKQALGSQFTQDREGE